MVTPENGTACFTFEFVIGFDRHHYLLGTTAHMMEAITVAKSPSIKSRQRRRVEFNERDGLIATVYDERWAHHVLLETILGCMHLDSEPDFPRGDKPVLQHIDLLLRNLSDVFGENDPCVVALQSTRSFTKTQCSMTPKVVYFLAVTRLTVLLV